MMFGRSVSKMTEIDYLIEKYRDLQQEKEAKMLEKDTDPALNDLALKLQTLQDIIQKVALRIGERGNSFGIAEITEKQNDCKEAIKKAWEDPEKKTYKSRLGTVTLKTTKSLVVDSVKTIVEFLLKNDKCEEGITKFNLPELRKYADAGLLNPGAAHYDEKQNVSIKLMEDK